VTEKTRQTNQQEDISELSLTRSPRRFVGVLWLLRWCSARFRGWCLSDRHTWRKGVPSLKHRRCNETKKYHPAQQSPHENDWFPGNKNPHGRTSGDEAPHKYRHYTAKPRIPFCEYCARRDDAARPSAKDFRHWVLTSEHANLKSHPLQAWPAQTEEIRTLRDAGEIDLSSHRSSIRMKNLLGS